MLTVAAVLALSTAACSNPEGRHESPDAALQVRLVIPDGHIREPEATCSGADAYRDVHPEVPFTVEDSAGQRVVSGSLPHGRAEEAVTLDVGDDPQPTICVMTLDLPGLDSVDDHVLIIDGRDPAPITRNPKLDDQPEVVLP
ncbi:hypothetical protein EF847_20485 [Actinobacteria bacterium YIM 96077]|uniref:Uncharacterized protein n=2 Tax=Phytoactinopolyspora halophila TaxID=1981511 RepID=A0A329QGL6_9ACTN|nr:hypothetical protein EF847_20485 [Actinobacteria bacterium YIM 96077]RAW11575.1 hypothetical protein DPM12_15965 [Phytoactinopolyspora halophila]